MHLAWSRVLVHCPECQLFFSRDALSVWGDSNDLVYVGYGVSQCQTQLLISMHYTKLGFTRGFPHPHPSYIIALSENFSNWLRIVKKNESIMAHISSFSSILLLGYEVNSIWGPFNPLALHAFQGSHIDVLCQVWKPVLGNLFRSFFVCMLCFSLGLLGLSNFNLRS